MSIRKYVIKSYLLLLSAIIFISIFWGCNMNIADGDWESNKSTIHGSGRLVTIQEDFTDFSQINLSHSFKANIFKSENYSVVLKMDDNILEHLESFKSNDKLSLGLEDGYNYNDITLEAEIGVPDITTIDLSGASAVELYGFEFSHSLNIYLSGASAVKGNITVGDILMDMSGASYINLAGGGKDLKVYASGASSVELPDFSVEKADMKLSGASYSKINVSDYLRIHLSGASVLYYTGNPTLGEVSVSGVSKIVRY